MADVSDGDLAIFVWTFEEAEATEEDGHPTEQEDCGSYADAQPYHKRLLFFSCFGLKI